MYIEVVVIKQSALMPFPTSSWKQTIETISLSDKLFNLHIGSISHTMFSNNQSWKATLFQNKTPFFVPFLYKNVRL